MTCAGLLFSPCPERVVFERLAQPEAALVFELFQQRTDGWQQLWPHLFAPYCLHRIEPGGADGGDQAGDKAHRGQDGTGYD